MTESRGHIGTRFSAVARQHAERRAVFGDHWQPTYGELDRASDRFAAAIVAHGGVVGDRVAVLMRHDAPLIAAVLGILKAGRIVVALNPGDPPDRQATVLADAMPALLVTDTENVSCVKELGKGLPAQVFSPTAIASDLGPPPRVDVTANHVACLVYTSGSTGHPKGVMKTHGHVLENARRLTHASPLVPDDRVIALASLSGGQGQSTTWYTLFNGATLFPFPAVERGVTGLPDWIDEQRISVYVSSASLYRVLVQTLDSRRLASLRIVRLASEPATVADLDAFANHFAETCRFENALSSSETGTIAHWTFDGDVPPENRLPVGRPVDGIRIDLHDENGNVVPDGHNGEMWIRGRYLAAGYWRDPELTATRFAPDPNHPGLLVFRGKDLARRMPDGTLMFAGRSDRRLKIRGYRIEPADIEAALLQQPSVQEAIVFDVNGPAGNRLLAAAVVCAAGTTSQPASLRTVLRKALPEYMVPARIVCLDAFPLSHNGKVDRQQLRAMAERTASDEPGTHPKTTTEVELARIWRDVFGVDAVYRETNFFELGGDSLLAARVAARIYEERGVAISLHTFRDAPTLKAFAKSVQRARRTVVATSQVPITAAAGFAPLSYEQEAIYQGSQTPDGIRAWTIAVAHQLIGDLDVDVLMNSMRQILERHDILRTTFERQDGELLAKIHSSCELPLEVLDFSSLANPRATANEFFRRQVQETSFDLSRLPLLRFWLLRLGEREHQLLRVHHHIITDAWSWRVYFQELVSLYEAGRRRSVGRLPAAPQYADYANWQRESLANESGEFRKCMKWWQRQFRRDARPIDFPFQRETPHVEGPARDGLLQWQIDPTVSERARRIAAQENTTYYAFHLAVFAATLAEATGEHDLVVGGYSTRRTRLAWQNMIGMFANTVTFRLPWKPRWSFQRWLALVSKTVADANEHGAIPYALLCQKLQAAGTTPPELRFLFTVSDHNAPIWLGGVQLTMLEREITTMPWGFSMQLDTCNESRCRTLFDARQYDPHGVRVFLDRYLELMDMLSSKPAHPMARIMSSQGPRGMGRTAGNPFSDAA